jgi:hypothetical protein
MQILGWREAAERKLTKYWTGTPCARGHASYRYVSSGACSECVRGYGKRTKPKTGMTKIEIRVHSEDASLIRDYADALLKARESS